MFVKTLKPLIALILGLLVLASCGGTKVYEVNKTIVYRDSIYNISETKNVTKKISGKLSDTEVQSLLNTERKEFDKLVKEHGEIYVRMSFMLDEQELIYRASNMDNGRDFERARDDFDSAGKKIAKLLGDKKATQLELR